jgi:hypothetical protein
MQVTWQLQDTPRSSQACRSVTLSIFGRPNDRADLQRARQIIAESGFNGLFDASKRGAAPPAAAFGPLVQLLAQSEEGQDE